MTNFTSASPQPQSTDAQHLRLLAIFHFVVAGLAVLGILFVLLHYTIMSTFLFDPKMFDAAKKAPLPPELVPLLKCVYLGVGCLIVAAGVANLLSGFFLRARRHRMFSLVVAGLNCMQVPAGTVLGVFTIIVLSRDSVRALYGETALAPLD